VYPQLAEVIIRLRNRDGRVTVIRTDNSKDVEIEKDGKVLVTVPGDKAKPEGSGKPGEQRKPEEPQKSTPKPNPEEVGKPAGSPKPVKTAWLADMRREAIPLAERQALGDPPELVGLLGSTRLRHDSAVGCVDFSPDGKRLATGSYDHTVRLWDAETGAPLLRLEGHPNVVNCVRFSPDGKQLASGSMDRVILWDPQTGKKRREIETKVGVSGLGFSPDGKRLAAGGGYPHGDLFVWDLETGREVHWICDEGGIESVSFSPDGRRLASGEPKRGAVGEYRVWDAQTGSLLRDLGEIKNYAGIIEFSPDGRWLATTGSTTSSEDVQLWDAVTYQPGPRLTPVGWDARFLRFSPDGKFLVSGDTYDLGIWDVGKASRVGTCKGSTDHFLSGVAISRDGKLAASVGESRVCLWDAATGKELFPPGVGHQGLVYAVAFSPDGERLASTAEAGAALIWDASTINAPVRITTKPEDRSGLITGLVWSPDGRLLSLSTMRTCAVWDVRGRKDNASHLSTPLPGTVELSPDGRNLFENRAIGTDKKSSEIRDWEIRDWDLATGTDRLVLTWTGKAPLDSAYSPASGRLAAFVPSYPGSQRGDIRLWDLSSKKDLGVLASAVRGNGPLLFSPDGKQLVGWQASSDASPRTHTLDVWDATTGKLALTLESPGERASLRCYRQDGRLLAGKGESGAVYLWDARTGKLEGRISVRTGLSALAFAPDGRHLVAGCGTGAVCILRLPDTLAASR
jgi:WD40 repeat protein